MSNKAETLHKAVFLDRDGTIMFDYGYIKDPNKVDVLPGVVEALELLLKNGYMVFIATNQSGIGRKMMTEKDVERVNEKLLSLIGRDKITDILICPHTPDDKCHCRKPETKLVKEVAKRHKLDLGKSFSIGDKDCDRQLGERFGGHGIKLGENGINTLLDAVKKIIR